MNKKPISTYVRKKDDSGRKAKALNYGIVFAAASTTCILIVVTISIYLYNEVGVNFSALRHIAPIVLCFLLIPFIPLATTSKKLSQKSAFDSIREDSRKPILYLRSFQSDVDSSSLGRVHKLVYRKDTYLSDEERLIGKLKRLGPVIAIEKPDEEHPTIGAARFRVADNKWKDAINDLTDESSLVVINIGSSATDGLWWEIKRALKTLPLERIVFFLPLGDGTQSNFKLNSIAEKNFIADNSYIEFFKKFRVELSHHTSIAIAESIGHAKVIGFTTDKQPVYSTLESDFFTEFLSEDLEKVILRHSSFRNTPEHITDHNRFRKYSDTIFAKNGLIIDCIESSDDFSRLGFKSLTTWILTGPACEYTSAFIRKRPILEIFHCIDNHDFRQISIKVKNRPNHFYFIIIKKTAVKVDSSAFMASLESEFLNGRKLGVWQKGFSLVIYRPFDGISIHRYRSLPLLMFISRHGRALKFFGGTSLFSAFKKLRLNIRGLPNILTANTLTAVLLWLIYKTFSA